MSSNDPLANALSAIQTAEQKGSIELQVPASSVIKQVLEKLQEQGYIGDLQDVEDKRARLLVKLSGMINKCGVIKPRYNVKAPGFEKFEKRYLPSKNMGVILVSTQQGIVTHHQAKEKNVGGRLIAYCY